MKIQYTHDVPFTYEERGRLIVLKAGAGPVDVPDTIAKTLVSKGMAKTPSVVQETRSSKVAAEVSDD